MKRTSRRAKRTSRRPIRNGVEDAPSAFRTALTIRARQKATDGSEAWRIGRGFAEAAQKAESHRDFTKYMRSAADFYMHAYADYSQAAEDTLLRDGGGGEIGCASKECRDYGEVAYDVRAEFLQFLHAISPD